MIAHRELIDHVAAHEGVAGTEEARRAVHAVVGVLSERLDPRVRAELQQQLPKSLWGDVHATRTAAADSGRLAQQVGRKLDCPPEHGLHLARAVVAEIALSAPELGEDLAASLPEELAQWSRDPIGTAGRSDTGVTDTPSRLDEETLRAALARLPDWAGDTRGITRAVQLPRDRIAPLLSRIDRIGRELHHAPHHERTGDGIVFTLRTASVGAVTTRDIEVAERVDQAVAEVGSGG